MNSKLLILQLLVIGFCQTVSATDNDSNIVITTATETYSFQYNKKNKEVDILQRSAVTYHCNDFRVSIPVVEFYNDKSTIDDVAIFVDGDKAKYIKPVYSCTNDAPAFNFSIASAGECIPPTPMIGKAPLDFWDK